MNILITGVTGFRNRGVDALVTPLIQALCERVNGARITIATCSPEYDQKRIKGLKNVDFVWDANLATGSWATPPIRGIKKRVFDRILSKLRISSQEIIQPPLSKLLPYAVPDLIIVSGGDIISSDYGTESLKHVLEPVKWAKYHGIPCVLLGQSIGIFKNEEHVEIWKQVQNDITLITAREPKTYDYLLSELRCPPEKVYLTTDIAFLLKASSTSHSAFYHDKSFPLIAVAASNLISRYSSGDDKQHVRAWRDIIKRFIEVYGAKVLLIPHVQESYSDDRIIATEIWRELEFDNRVNVMAADLSASEFKGIISCCDMVLAERMHAAIAGFSSGVCTIPVSYSIKAQGITSQLYECSQYDVSDVCLSVDDLLNLEYSIPHIDKVWQAYDEHSELLRNRKAEMVDLAEMNLDLLLRLIGNDTLKPRRDS